MNVSRVRLIVHEGKTEALGSVEAIRTHLAERDIAVVDEGEIDLVVSLGGDGTMLRAAQAAHRSDALLLGINMGTLGYLTEVDAVDALQAIDKVVAGDHFVEERMMLDCSVRTRGSSTSMVGLNEVLVERAARHRLVRLSVTVGGEHLGFFNADGLIVATPTGSTAYALSAGGPIVSPRSQCLVVVPVSAHMIFARPFVLAADETVEIKLEGSGSQAEVTLDGDRSVRISPGDGAVIKRHERPLKLVRLGGPGFVERLRTKMGLP